LLKNHVSTFIDCFDAVAKVDGMITERGGGTGITADMEQVINRITTAASELYQPMLDKRRECERDRTALAVLNTYKCGTPAATPCRIAASTSCSSKRHTYHSPRPSLHRRYLFSLPKDLMLKLREEDWPAVIAGYARAKTAKTQTAITVFAEILEVIETIIETVCSDAITIHAPAATPTHPDAIAWRSTAGAVVVSRWQCA
jgi:hypothetical protein